jgi:hypothetical protein
MRLVSNALQHQQAQELIETMHEFGYDTAFEPGCRALTDHVNQYAKSEEVTMFPQATQALATPWEKHSFGFHL